MGQRRPLTPPRRFCLDCFEYGKYGRTAITRLADAIFTAFAMISSSINASFAVALPYPDCTKKTSQPRTVDLMVTVQLTDAMSQPRTKRGYAFGNGVRRQG